MSSPGDLSDRTLPDLEKPASSDYALDGCHLLDQPPAFWEEAGELGALLGRRGATVKLLDLLIAAYALSHGVAVLTRDADFERMRRAGLSLLLVEV